MLFISLVLTMGGLVVGQNLSVPLIPASNVSLTPAQIQNVVGATPDSANGYAYIGCATSNGNFPNFKKASSSGPVGVVQCSALCSSRIIAISSQNLCFCSNDLDKSTTIDVGVKCTPDSGGSSWMSVYAQKHPGAKSGQASTSGPSKDKSNSGKHSGANTATNEEEHHNNNEESHHTISNSYNNIDNSTHVNINSTTNTVNKTKSTGNENTVNIGNGNTVTKEGDINGSYNTIEINNTSTNITCYGDYCASNIHCDDSQCTNYRVVCIDSICFSEETNDKNFDRLVVCKNNSCNYQKCSGESCNKKIVCQNGKCNREPCRGEECEQNLYCKGPTREFKPCRAEKCYNKYICTDNEICMVQPPCTGIPPPPKPCDVCAESAEPVTTGSSVPGSPPVTPPYGPPHRPGLEGPPTSPGSPPLGNNPPLSGSGSQFGPAAVTPPTVLVSSSSQIVTGLAGAAAVFAVLAYLI